MGGKLGWVFALLASALAGWLGTQLVKAVDRDRKAEGALAVARRDLAKAKADLAERDSLERRGETILKHKKLCMEIVEKERKYTNFLGWNYEEPSDDYPFGRCRATFRQKTPTKCVDPGPYDEKMSKLWRELRQDYNACKRGEFINEY